MILKGQSDSYSFDPSDKGSLLRANGKFGSTYTGKRNSDGQKVVIKQLNPALAGDEKAVKRFMREAVLEIGHPGLARGLDYIRQGNAHFLAREFFAGSGLPSYLHKFKADTQALLDVTIKTCGALAALHEKGIIHCDIRPSNILVGDDMQVKLIDLGLAFFPGDPPAERSPFALIYSPPEQVMNCGEAVNSSSDIYSLAVTLYECLSGNVPFQHENPEMMMQLMINMPLQPHRRIPDPVFQVLLKATAKYKFPLPPNKYRKDDLVKLMRAGQENRYFSAGMFAHDLAEAAVRGKKKKNFWKRWLD
jgi:serine/threonine-protein kinase